MYHKLMPLTILFPILKHTGVIKPHITFSGGPASNLVELWSQE